MKDKRVKRVRIDREKCIGIGNCVAVAATVFQLDEENKAIVLDPASVSEEVLFEAAESCPQDAVVLEDDRGQQVYP